MKNQHSKNRPIASLSGDPATTKSAHHMKLAREDAILALLALVHIWAAPYTKVEESFNVQATHDFLYVLPSNLFGGGGGGSDAATTTTVTSAPNRLDGST